MCDQPTTRIRTCHNPTPCNGGEDCTQFGRDTLTKDCGKYLKNYCRKLKTAVKNYSFKDLPDPAKVNFPKNKYEP